MHASQDASAERKLNKLKANKERTYTKHELNVLVEKTVKKAMKKRGEKCEEELRAFENMSFSDCDKSKIESSLSEI